MSSAYLLVSTPTWMKRLLSRHRTSGVGITYQKGESVCISLEVFADADYASRATDRRSMLGGAIMCGGA